MTSRYEEKLLDFNEGSAKEQKLRKRTPSVQIYTKDNKYVLRQKPKRFGWWILMAQGPELAKERQTQVEKKNKEKANKSDMHKEGRKQEEWSKH